MSVGAGIGLVYILADALTLGLAGDELGPYIALGGGLMLTGGILWLGNRIFGTIRPISFQKKYNSSLKSALGLDGIVDDISFVPVVDPVNSQFGLLTHITF